jgi:hypothetical protein
VESENVPLSLHKVHSPNTLVQVRYRDCCFMLGFSFSRLLALTVDISLSSSGRLWASLVQLRHEDGEWHQVQVLKRALKAVPKSGEVRQTS